VDNQSNETKVNSIFRQAIFSLVSGAISFSPIACWIIVSFLDSVLIDHKLLWSITDALLSLFVPSIFMSGIFGILGLILGIKSLKSNKKPLAIGGIVLSSFGILYFLWFLEFCIITGEW
jgi:hypothetical protein